MSRNLIAFIAVVALAGCVAEPADDGTPITAARDDLVAHRAEAGLEVPAAWSALRTLERNTDLDRAEPTIGVTSTGTIFLSAPDGAIIRSTDQGATWTDVTAPDGAPTDLDPWIWVDPATDRVYNSPLYTACSWLTWSDDEGATWDLNPQGGCGTPAHHYQKLTTGPPPAGVTTDGYPNIVYYSTSSLRNPDPNNPTYLIVAGTGTWITASRDGGRTWPLATEVHPPTPGCPDSQGSPVAVAPDGTAYSAQNNCGTVRFASSRDGGSTWSHVSTLRDVGYLRFGSEPAVATDAEGTVYLAYPGEDATSYLRTSRDHGVTWGPAIRLSPPSIKATMFTVIAVGNPGEVVVAYVGTDSDPATWPSRDTSYAPDDVVWHLYLTFTEDATSAEPTFVTHRVNPADDPIQRGCIWLQGGSNPCRNLADFIDVTVQGGRAYLTYADGCLDCEDAAGSRDRKLHMAFVNEGPSLDEGLLDPLVAT